FSFLCVFLSSSFLFCLLSLTVFYTVSLHDALPILLLGGGSTLIWEMALNRPNDWNSVIVALPLSVAALIIVSLLTQKQNRDIQRSEEHTSELQSRFDLVCRLLLEKKNK